MFADNKNEIIMTMKLELMTLQGGSNGILQIFQSYWIIVRIFVL